MTIVASLNDYWKILKLDVLFAPDKKKDNSKDETNELPDDCTEPSNSDEKENDVTPKGKTFFVPVCQPANN